MGAIGLTGTTIPLFQQMNTTHSSDILFEHITNNNYCKFVEEIYTTNYDINKLTNIDDINSVNNTTLLMTAILLSKKQFAIFLLNHDDIDVTITTNTNVTALTYACASSYNDIALTIMDKLENHVNELEILHKLTIYNCSPLTYACQNGMREVVTRLLKTVPNDVLNTRDCHGMLPIDYAIKSNIHDIAGFVDVL